MLRETDGRQVQLNFAGACTLEQLNGSKHFMVCRRSIGYDPVSLHEDVAHRSGAGSAPSWASRSYCSGREGRQEIFLNWLANLRRQIESVLFALQILKPLLHQPLKVGPRQWNNRLPQYVCGRELSHPMNRSRRVVSVSMPVQSYPLWSDEQTHGTTHTGHVGSKLVISRGRACETSLHFSDKQNPW